MLRPIIYTAGKYRDPRGLWFIDLNINLAREWAADLWSMGWSVICPHANTAHMDGVVSAKDFIEGDLAQIAKCDAILMLRGWEHSEGARQEHEFAQLHRVKVFYATDPDVVGKLGEFKNEFNLAGSLVGGDTGTADDLGLSGAASGAS
jgi:hypothetical protein